MVITGCTGVSPCMLRHTAVHGKNMTAALTLPLMNCTVKQFHVKQTNCCSHSAYCYTARSILVILIVNQSCRQLSIERSRRSEPGSAARWSAIRKCRPQSDNIGWRCSRQISTLNTVSIKQREAACVVQDWDHLRIIVVDSFSLALRLLLPIDSVCLFVFCFVCLFAFFSVMVLSIVFRDSDNSKTNQIVFCLFVCILHQLLFSRNHPI